MVPSVIIRKTIRDIAATSRSKKGMAARIG